MRATRMVAALIAALALTVVTTAFATATRPHPAAG